MKNKTKQKTYDLNTSARAHTHMLGVCESARARADLSLIHEMYFSPHLLFHFGRKIVYLSIDMYIYLHCNHMGWMSICLRVLLKLIEWLNCENISHRPLHCIEGGTYMQYSLGNSKSI